MGFLLNLHSAWCFNPYLKNDNKKKHKGCVLINLLSLAPCILASLEGDVNHCRVGKAGKRGLTPVIHQSQKKKLALPQRSRQGR